MKKNNLITIIAALTVCFLTPALAVTQTTPAINTQAPVTQTQPTTQVANLPYTDAAIATIAQNATLAVYNYSYLNYKEKLLAASRYFTPQGWQAFGAALAQTKNLGVMNVHQMTMVGTLLGNASIVGKQLTTTQSFWTVQVPVQVVYTSAKNEKIIHKLMVKLLITNNPSDSNSTPAVAQFISKPMS